MSEAYIRFLTRKAISDPMTGLSDVPELPACLFPHQRDIVAWALRRGRSALFAGTGLGKSLMELAWAQAVHNATGKDILHLAPLAVSAQMAREADKFGIPARVVAKQSDCGPGDTVLTPFLGIGSEVYGAVTMGRKGIGIELKPSYFSQAKRNLEQAKADMGGLFASAAS